ncbi:hypothetical protein A3H16_03640 [Candidatus Kaiserbacteria bacterium RIFCSPLOWO2_12_FULL_53_8]|uniref:Uncharacterized protein n=2 Tax=Candidatus Kaiseribacteriota TaxID=1752734 RepID=A0A1F6CTI0_9BACT|nr:MAG: hypothetical protein A2851_05385 [Candidatus Kaiserbacteria bacterium RIFCSPHIGHO2_01_FULL_53_29]OGG92141.1 MAG: hypothetical protein A3H16_03640 [Candidatus Kaiserbacteria bacterium RIFCSPLOWO2_12_FULL_53_8]
MKNPISQNQMYLFASPREQGAREWNTFNAVRHDHAGAFRVLTPRKAEAPRYPNIVHISRYPRHIALRLAR